MKYPMYYVGGSKGGVGKSLVSFALVDYLISRDQRVLLMDSDTDNPDVYKAHKHADLPALVCKMHKLDNADGWADMLNTVESHPEHVVVINSAARSKEGTSNYGELLKAALEALGRELITFWVINRHRDSIELLHSFQHIFSEAPIHVCRNLHFGTADRFDLYNNSKIKEKVEQTGTSLDFPELASRVVDTLYSGRTTIWKAVAELPIGNRVELLRWRSRCAEMFSRALPGIVEEQR
jgi:MinD-like ATPase involved in chromosome partitioning or flagellar assembly